MIFFLSRVHTIASCIKTDNLVSSNYHEEFVYIWLLSCAALLPFQYIQTLLKTLPWSSHIVELHTWEQYSLYFQQPIVHFALGEKNKQQWNKTQLGIKLIKSSRKEAHIYFSLEARIPGTGLNHAHCFSEQCARKK